MKVYTMIYDDPLGFDGVKKRNRLLGDFEIIETLRQDRRTSLRVGTLGIKVYIIEGIEVGGPNSGIRFQVYEVPKTKKIIYI